MRVKIAKWGNSVAVRLPKVFADELGLVPGKIVDLDKHGTRLTIAAAANAEIQRYRLEDLLSRIEPGAKPPPVEDWSAAEPAWPDDDWSDVVPREDEWERGRWEGEKRGAKRRRRKRT